MMEPIFENSHNALLFAYHFGGQQYAETPMSKLMKGSGLGTGKGLIGLDGAGQAGMIKKQVETLSKLHQACIVARFSPRFRECPCCGGDKMNEPYREALAVLAEWSLSCFAGLSIRQMREAIIRSYFEKDKKLVSNVAARLNVAPRTAYDQKSKILPALSKIDKAAFGQIDELLQPMLQIAA